MNRHLGEDKLNKNLSRLKKSRVKGDIRLSIYILIHKVVSVFTKDSLETQLKKIAEELGDLKYENSELKKRLKDLEKEKKAYKDQIDDLLHQVDLSEFRDLKSKALKMEAGEKEMGHHRAFFAKVELFFEENEVRESVQQCLDTLATAKDNFQKLKVVRQFLSQVERFEWVQKRLTLFYRDKLVKKNIKDMPLVTKTLTELRGELSLDSQVKRLQKAFETLKGSLERE